MRERTKQPPRPAKALGIPTNLISVAGNRIEVEHAHRLSAQHLGLGSDPLLLHNQRHDESPEDCRSVSET